MEINSGFLAGLSLQLPVGLTCVIGPRGSGKSTLAEALRYCLGGPNRVSSSGLLQANLSSSIITVTTAAETAERGYTVRRGFKQNPTVVTQDGRTISSLDLDRGSFLPLDAYNSDEIEAIANETLGEKRRALLDDLRQEELRSISLELSEARRALSANADAITATRRTIRDLTEQIEEIGDARARLASLPPPPPDAISNNLVRVSQQYQSTEDELRDFDRLAAAAVNWKESIHRMRTQQKSEFRFGPAHATSANGSLVGEIAATVEAFISGNDEQFLELTSRVDKLIEGLQPYRSRLEAARLAQGEQVSLIQKANAAAGDAVRERLAAEQTVEKLIKLEERRCAELQRQKDLLQKRRDLKADYLLKRESVSTLREDIANTLQRKIGESIRLRVLRNADSLAYQQMLLHALKGARVRNHDEILAALMRVRPEQLAQLIQDNDIEEFESLMSLGHERSSKIIESFRSTLNPLEVEVIEIQDRVSIELNVGPAGHPHFKDASELSQGQKCTALLPLLLSRRDMPLLIDQPEDNLDNHFIYETVVNAVRRLRDVRQMVFITHNANIPVLGEADLVVVMNSDGKRGFVEKTGNLDSCRDEIIDLLEGGRAAFDARSRRYGK